MHPRVQWVCGLHLNVCMWDSMHAAVVWVCEPAGMTNDISSPDIHLNKNTCMSLWGAALSISMQISTTNHTALHSTTDGSTCWWKTSRDTSITKSITIDHSVNIRGHKAGRMCDKGIFCMKLAENIGELCRIGISPDAISGNYLVVEYIPSSTVHTYKTSKRCVKGSAG